MEFAREEIRTAVLHAAIGGFHLFRAAEETLRWTAERLRDGGVENIVGAHCTGIEALHRLRELTGLERRTAVVGAIGAVFELGTGIDPGAIAR